MVPFLVSLDTYASSAASAAAAAFYLAATPEQSAQAVYTALQSLPRVLATGVQGSHQHQVESNHDQPEVLEWDATDHTEPSMPEVIDFFVDDLEVIDCSMADTEIYMHAKLSQRC